MATKATGGIITTDGLYTVHKFIRTKVIGADLNPAVTHDSLQSPYLCAMKVVATADASLNALEVYSNASGNVRVALYSDVAGVATAVLSQSDSVAVTGGRWNSIPIPSVNVVLGTTYWICTQGDTNGATVNNLDGSSGNWGYQGHSYGAFSAPLSLDMAGGTPAFRGFAAEMFTPYKPGNIEALIVAGGGGGGGRHGAGGGAGGLLHLVAVPVLKQSYAMLVGPGGQGAIGGDIGYSENSATSGGNSAAFGLTALGGGWGPGSSTGTDGGSGSGGGLGQGPGRSLPLTFLVAGTPSADSEYGGFEAPKAVDESLDTRFSTNGGGYPHWWKYDLGVGVTKVIRRIRLFTFSEGYGAGEGHTKGKDFKIQGSNDNSNWADIYTGVIADLAEKALQEFSFDNATSYRYYRVYVSTTYPNQENGQSGDWSVWEVQMFEARQGHDGGPGGGQYQGGGGGGAGGEGQSFNIGGIAGLGLELSITGAPITYAAGGKGAEYNLAEEGVAGASDTGTGGGGSGWGGSKPGAPGGSGIIVVRYLTADQEDRSSPFPTFHRV